MDFRHFHSSVTAETFSESQFWTGRAKFSLKAPHKLMVGLQIAQGRYATCRGRHCWGCMQNALGSRANIMVCYDKCFTG